MDMLLTETVTGIYALLNGLRLLSYIPQIASVVRDRTGAWAIALSTWSIWSATNLATALYAAVVVDDLLLTLISLGNAICCFSVVVLVIEKRRRARGGIDASAG